MEYFPPALEKMVEQFARLPGVGKKTAQRLAFFVLSLPEAEVEEFAQSVREAKQKIGLCPVCRNLTEGDGLCPVCASAKREPGDLRGGRPQGRDRFGALPGVSGNLPCASRRALTHEPCGP